MAAKKIKRDKKKTHQLMIAKWTEGGGGKGVNIKEETVGRVEIQR